MGSNKIAVIGIDGGDFAVFAEMIKRGLMPNLDRIINRSFVSDLDTYVNGPGQGWASFMTGKPPCQHGFYYWKVVSGASSKDLEGKFIWDVLGENGYTSCIINMSYTFPPKDIKGWMISGLGGGLVSTSNANYTHPEDLIEELREKADGYIWGVERVNGKISKQITYCYQLIEMTRKRCQAALYLIKEKKPDFFNIVFRGADSIQHQFWPFVDPKADISPKFSKLKDAIELYYKCLDDSLYKIWKELADYKKIIISDHGFGPVNILFNINEFLAREGYLAKKRNLKSFLGADFFYLIRKLLKPMYLKFFARYKTLRDMNSKRKQKFPKVLSSIDLKKTRLYATNQYGIHFNERFDFSKNEKKALYEEIREKLLNYKDDKTGRLVFKDLYMSESLNIKKHKESAPDLVFEMQDEDIFVNQEFKMLAAAPLTQYPTDKNIFLDNGGHKRNGIIISELALRNEDLPKISDIYPSILKYLHIETPMGVGRKCIF